MTRAMVSFVRYVDGPSVISDGVPAISETVWTGQKLRTFKSYFYKNQKSQ